MTSATLAARLPQRVSRRWSVLSFLKNAIVGTLLSSNPFTAVIVLGWFVRRMKAQAGGGAGWPNWVSAPHDTGMRRWLGGLAANTREGLSAASALLLATLPCTALWALTWWAGWNNSFAKGYEDAALGPLLSLMAVALSLPVIALLPMALARRAAEARWRSLFEIGAIWRLIARVPGRYALLLLLWAVFALGFTLFRLLPLAAEDLWPGFAGFDEEAVNAVRTQITLAHAAFIFLSLLLLRGLSMRLYLVARSRLETPRAHALLLAPCAILMLATSLVVVAQIYLAQFMNYRTSVWFLHPLLTLPGVP